MNGSPGVRPATADRTACITDAREDATTAAFVMSEIVPGFLPKGTSHAWRKPVAATIFILSRWVGRAAGQARPLPRRVG